jgi:hypothetical protein
MVLTPCPTAFLIYACDERIQSTEQKVLEDRRSRQRSGTIRLFAFTAQVACGRRLCRRDLTAALQPCANAVPSPSAS